MDEHDAILLDRWSTTGDSQAFMEIVTRYQGMVYGVCLRILRDHSKAEDIVQESFLKLTKSRPKASHALGPWLHRVATNNAISYLRSDSRRKARETTYMDQRSIPTPPEWNDVGEILDQALDALPEENRSVIVAHYLEGRTQVDVAQHLNIPRSTVTSRIRTGLNQLQHKMKAKGITLPAAALGGMMLSEITQAAPSSLTTSMGKAVLCGEFSHAKPVISSWYAGLSAACIVLMALAALWGIPSFNDQEPIEHVTTSTTTLSPSTPLTKSQNESHQAKVILESPDVTPTLPITEEPIEIATTEPKIIRLRCVDEQGNPVPQAQVYVQQEITLKGGPSIIVWDPEMRSIQDIKGPILSDKDGYIEFPLLESDGKSAYPQIYALVPNKQVGLWRSYIDYDNPKFKENDTVRMVNSTSIPGQVTIPEGYDIRSVRVQVTYLKIDTPGKFMGTSYSSNRLNKDSTFSKTLEVPVDREGRFKVPNVPKDGSFSVRANGEGLGQWQIRIDTASQADWIELPLQQEGFIKGTVHFADTGAPASNRLVYCKATSHQAGNTFVGTTNNLGEYSIGGLPEGKYELAVALGDYPPERVAHGRKNISVEIGQSTDDIDFQLELGKLIQGTVTHQETGKPIPNVGIGATSPAKPNSSLINSTVSDEQGKFSIRLMEGYNRLYIASTPREFQQPGFIENIEVQVSTTNEPHEPVDIQLATNPNPIKEVVKVPIQGRVFDQQKNPIEGVLVTAKHKWSLSPDSWTYSRIPLGHTDKQGRFSTEIAAGTEHEVIIGGNEWSAHSHEPITLKEEDSHTFESVYLWRHEAKMSILVLDEEENPITSAHIYVKAPNYYEPGTEAKTDPNGMAYLKNLPDTEINLTIAHLEYKAEKWKGLAGEHIEVILKPRKK